MSRKQKIIYNSFFQIYLFQYKLPLNFIKTKSSNTCILLIYNGLIRPCGHLYMLSWEALLNNEESNFIRRRVGVPGAICSQ